MGNVKINSFQMFCLIVLFDLGTALVVSLGLTAGKDAWLANFVGCIGGVGIYLIYNNLYKSYPTMAITSYSQKIMGKYLGWPIGFLCVVYFLHEASRDLRDYGDLISTTMFDKTPLLILNLIMLIAMTYVLYLGIEALGRMSEIFLFILICLGLLANALLIFSSVVDIHNLFPLLLNGWKPIIKTLPLAVTFPYAEMLPFTVLLPYLNNVNNSRRIGISAILLCGVILSFTVVMDISVLGDDIASRSPFPLLNTIRKVNIADFIQRLDPIVILTLVIGNFFKVAIFYFAAVIGIGDLFKIDNHKKLIIPIGVVILITSLTISSSLPEHLKEGLEILPIFIHPTIAIAIPALLLVVDFMRKKIH